MSALVQNVICSAILVLWWVFLAWVFSKIGLFTMEQCFMGVVAMSFAMSLPARVKK